MTVPPDLANLPRFLTQLGDRDAGAAVFARRLLDDGWTVASFFGPEQMDVWALTLRRGDRAVHFGIERGIVDGALVTGDADAERPAYRPLALAVLGWARSAGVDLVFDDPLAFRPDLGAYGMPALGWLEAGNDEAHARIVAAQRAHFTRWYGPESRAARSREEARARGIREIEVAAAPRSG